MTRRLLRLGLEVWVPVTGVVAWWFLSDGSNSPFFPPLRRIVEAFRENWLFERVPTDLVPSLWHFAVGLALAAVLGVGLGLFLGLWTPARRALSPVIDFLRAIPAPALISIFILLVGFGASMKISSIAFAAMFPVLLNTIDGVRGVEPVQIDMARAYRLSRSQRVRHVILPAATPQIFAGLRVSLAVALLVMAFGEMFAGADGLGYFIVFAQETYAIPDMWSGIIMLGLVGYGVNLVFMMIERRVLRWHRGWRASTRDSGALT